MTWQRIETAPKDGTRIILFVPNYHEKIWIGEYKILERFEHGRRTYLYEGWQLGIMGSFGDKTEPTHWMPLPEPPKENP